MKPILALLLTHLLVFPHTSGASSSPNVVLIMADDLGYGDLSCNGSTRLKTPHLDALAASGVRLTSFYTGATVCTPSRMALMSGYYPPRAGWKGGVLGYKMKTANGLHPKALTVAEHFQAAGYETFMSGKWHLGSTPELSPTAQGFDAAYYIKMSNNQTKKLFRDNEVVEDPFDNRLLSQQFTDVATDFIRAERKKPFFLYLPYTAPHFPAQAHPDWKDHSTNHAYGDVVEELDHRIGEVVEALDQTGQRDNTLVVFLSDNGPDPSQRKWATAEPHRGLKWSSREGGTRVPCIVSWPGTVPGGQVCGDIVASVDLLPTLTKAAGVQRQPHPADVPSIDGLDVWPTLLGKTTDTKHPRHALLFWSGWATPQAIRHNDWKLYFDTVKDVRGSKDGPVLFDLANDPAETKNLAADHPERVAELLHLARTRLADIDSNQLPLGGPPHTLPDPKPARWLAQ